MTDLTPIRIPWQMTDAVSVIFFGKVGAGKTSTINALLGLDWPTDNAVACTKACQAVVVTDCEASAGVRKLIVVDTPGVGEDTDADRAYFDEYKYCVSQATHIVWLFQADTRVYRPDQVMLRELKPFFRQSAIFTVGLNQVDRIGPGNWSKRRNQPSPTQSRNIRKKMVDIETKFSKIMKAGQEHIIPYSAFRGYGMDTLRKRIFDHWR